MTSGRIWLEVIVLTIVSQRFVFHDVAVGPALALVAWQINVFRSL